MATLIKWNRRINLVSKKERNLLHHFYDSLVFAQAVPPGETVMDVGSGGGFPGLVTQLARPDLRVTLFEPREKRVAFLTTVNTHLKAGATIHRERVEKGSQLGFYDHAVCKAFTDLVTWEQLVSPLAGTLWFLASDHQQKAMAPHWRVVTSWAHQGHGGRHLLRYIPKMGGGEHEV